ncbi:MAG: hypothetical protein LHV68_12665 [Elusimicrobia bacterium]|nr:hypothetical protein [Candidatus Liberimonas magnetica]
MNIYKYKIFVFIIILILVFNSIIRISDFETTVTASLPVIQSSIFQIESCTRQPLKIIADSIKDIPFSPEYKQPKKNQNKNKDSQRNSSFSFSNQKEGVSLNLKIDKNERSQMNNLQTMISDIKILNAGPPRDWPPGLFYVFLLMYLVLLSKSNLPWEITVKLFSTAQFRLCGIGFFYLYVR